MARPVVRENPSIWPKAIGIFSIVSAALILLIALLFLGVVFFGGPHTFTSGHTQAKTTLDLQIERNVMLILAVESVIAIILTLMLIVGAIMLLCRHRHSRKVLIAWAIAGLTFNWLSYLALLFLPEEMKTSPVTVEMLGATDSALTIGADVAMSIYPIFMLIWLCRPRIRDEVARW